MSSPILGLVLAFLAPQGGAAPPVGETDIAIRGGDANSGLRTFCLDRDGRLFVLVGPARARTVELKDSSSEVRVLDRDGKLVKSWKVDFQADALAVGADGDVYVAGTGKVARYDADGKRLRLVHLAHAAALQKHPDSLVKRLKAQVDQQRQTLDSAVKLLKDRKERIEARPPAERTQLDNRQLAECVNSLRQAEIETRRLVAFKADAAAADLALHLRSVMGVTVSPRDVFIVCGEEQHFSYSVWRFDHDLGNPKHLLSGLSACGTQADVQADGIELLVAENARHCYVRYDRDGKKLAEVAVRGKGTGPASGWCSPMNLCVLPKGDVLASESNGVVKRFSADGEYQGVVVGRTRLERGGCGPAAIAYWPRDNRLYLADVFKSRIVVLNAVAPTGR